MRLILVDTDRAWQQFVGFYKYRNLPEPPRPPDGIWVAEENGTLLGGVCLYPTEGCPYVMVEHVSTRPNANPRMVYYAMQMGLAHMVSYATARGRVLVCFPRDEGVARALERGGFKMQPARVLTLAPGGLTVGVYEPKVRAPDVADLGGAEVSAEEPEPEESTPDEPVPVKGAARMRRKP